MDGGGKGFHQIRSLSSSNSVLLSTNDDGNRGIRRLILNNPKKRYVSWSNSVSVRKKESYCLFNHVTKEKSFTNRIAFYYSRKEILLNELHLDKSFINHSLMIIVDRRLFSINNKTNGKKIPLKWETKELLKPIIIMEFELNMSFLSVCFSSKINHFRYESV